MSRIVLITGGCRSGKSDFAVELAHQLGSPVTFLATCLPCDDEMRQRVALHQQTRPAEWHLMEEAWEPGRALAAISAGVVLLDCVPTWIGNLLMRGDSARAVESTVEAFAETLAACRAQVVLVVSAEVGDGLVPEYPMGRSFRDCVGRANQVLARRAETVFLLTAGLARELKCNSVTPAEVARGLYEPD